MSPLRPELITHRPSHLFEQRCLIGSEHFIHNRPIVPQKSHQFSIPQAYDQMKHMRCIKHAKIRLLSPELTECRLVSRDDLQPSPSQTLPLLDTMRGWQQPR
ncbi:hypothetical protein E4U56_000639 [Claviceps arundinis]|uniref:Uncharacterized protein n=1 Tax=Claviceps arundinis TaxID=1623583 RepID=A0A9P7MRQ3_9HYPO|nr:hypothetical protein E4U56_000639 [Claviceps arundinis]